MISTKHCLTEEDFSRAKQITRAYMDWLDMDLSFQDTDKEMAEFAHMYGPPQGLFILAFDEALLAGGVGLREFAPGVSEMKRLFVLDQFKGKGVGKVLCKALIEQARKAGYLSMRLDTLERLEPARRLYLELGFKEIEAYRYNPSPGVLYMELML